MIINNKKDSIYILVDEDLAYADASYTVHKIGPEGCVVETPEVVGSLDNEGATTFSLPDGTYKIVVVSNDTSFVQLEQFFIVVYNFLPTMIDYMEDILCKGEDSNCSSCGEITDELIHQNFYKVNLYLICKGFIPHLHLLRVNSCRNFKVIEQEEELYSYYGRFNYDFKTKIREFFVYLYINLYYMHTSEIRVTEDTLLPVFKLETLKQCMYKLGFNYESISCSINNLNCNCDE